jgi:hypothetical protein
MAKHSRSLSSLDSARNSLGDEVAKEIRRVSRSQRKLRQRIHQPCARLKQYD